MKTNNLKHNISLSNKKVNCLVEIRLNDECKNGHQDFAITSCFWEIGKARTDRTNIMGGCCHDEILQHFPNLKIFVDLHLCDYDGIPMYAIENGFYHLSQGFENLKGKTQKEYFCNYYRVTPTQYDTLITANDKDYFGFLLASLGVLKQWKKEADKAIKTLEKLTGNEFVNDSVKSQFNMTEEQLKEVESKIKNGFYTKESIDQRQTEKIEAEKNAFIKEAAEKRDKAIQNAQIEYKVQLLVLNSGLSLKNTIYYNHSNTLSFNWKSYEPKISEKQFKDFCNKLNLDEFKGLTVNMADLKIEYSPIN